MRRLLSVLGGFFLVVLLLGGSMFGYVAWQGRGADASSKAYVETNLPIILSGPSKAALLDRAAPALLDTVRDKGDDLDRLFRAVGRFGAFQGLDSCTGEARVFVNLTGRSTVTASYSSTARFEKGNATVALFLLKSGESWLIQGFHVESPLLYQ